MRLLNRSLLAVSIRTLTLATILLLSSFVCRGELLIYKGASKETFFGNFDQERRSLKVLLIIDHDAGYFSSISYTTINGNKRYTTSQHTNSHIVELNGTNGKKQTAVTHIPTDCEAQENPGQEGIYFKGANATLTVNTGTTVSFPKVMTDSGNGLSHTQSGAPYSAEGSSLFVFNQRETQSSNQAGETLDAAFARLVAQIESLGYTR